MDITCARPWWMVGRSLAEDTEVLVPLNDYKSETSFLCVSLCLKIAYMSQ